MFGILGTALGIGAAIPDPLVDLALDEAKNKAVEVGLKTIGIQKGTKKK
jgi:hypothetical protein|tara:strand:- start:627 stop:773 length:147 start_codon:yes stop_codon:yes gene_type:complete